MNLATRNLLIERIGRIGKSGRLPLSDKDTDAAMGEVHKVVGEVSSALREVVDHLFLGPVFGPDGNLFMIDARPSSATYNILSTTEATRNGLAADAGYCIYNHGKGYALNRCVTTFWALASPSPGSQQTRSGGFRVFTYNNNRTVFQIDAEAGTQQAVGILSCFSSFHIPAPNTPFKNQGVISGTADRVAATTTLHGP